MVMAKWALLLGDIYEHKAANCPVCGHKVEYDISVDSDRRGYAVLKCPNCKRTAEFSRIRVPEGYDIEDRTIFNRISR